MNTTTSPRRATRALLAGTASSVLLTGLATTVGTAHAADPRPARADASVAQPPAATPAATQRTAPLGTTSYVALTTRSGREYLRLVNRRTGTIIRTIASAPVRRDDNRAFEAVSLLRNGTVFFVRPGTGRTYAANGPIYGNVLYRANPASRVARVMKGVQTAQVSPDERSLAVTQATHRAKARYMRQTIRIGSVRGGTFATTYETRLPTDPTGASNNELAMPWVETWVGQRTVLFSRGCCADYTYRVLRKDGSSRFVLNGSDESRVLGQTRQNEALIFTDWVQRKNDGTYNHLGYRVVKVGSSGRDKVVWSAKNGLDNPEAAAITATRPVTSVIPPGTYPYAGKDKVIEGYI